MSSARWTNAALWTLRLGFAISSLGAFALWRADGGPLFSTVHEDFGGSESLAGVAGSIATYGTLVLGLLVLLPTASISATSISTASISIGRVRLGADDASPKRRTALSTTWLLLGLLTLAVTTARSIHQTYRPELVHLCHGVRWLAPLGVWLLLRNAAAAAAATDGRSGERLLRIAAAATFAGHGLEALDHNAKFVDYIYSASTMVGAAHDEAMALRLLTGIGLLDLVVAAALLIVRSPAVALWMTCWGLLTAGARIVHLGSNGWPEAAIRATNFAVPLTLAIAWARPHAAAMRGNEPRCDLAS